MTGSTHGAGWSATSYVSPTGSRAVSLNGRDAKLLEGLMEHSQDAITLNDGVSRRFLAVSDSFCVLTGYSREELIGRTAREVGLIGDDPRRSAAVANAGHGIGAVIEPEVRRKDGTLREVEVSTLPLDDNNLVLTISRDVSERKRTERELAAHQEARFRAAAESTRDGLAFISPVRDDRGEITDFRFEYVNDAYCELVRFERRRLLGRRLDEVFPGFAGSGRFADCRQVSLTGEPCHTEDVAPGDVDSTPARAGRVLDVSIATMGEELVVSARDVTERRRVEAQLRASEQRFRDIVESAPDAIVIVNGEGEIMLVNTHAEKLFGYTREELVGHNQELLVPEPLWDVHQADRASYLTDPSPRPMASGLELVARRKDGSQVPVEISLGPLDVENTTLVCSTIRDVTERKHAEYELRASRERLLAEAERVAGIGSFERDLISDTVSFSDGMLAMYGRSAEELDGIAASRLGLVHPDDQEHVTQTIERAIAEQSSYSVEYRVIRPDGRVRNLRSHGDVAVDDNGQPTRVIGVVQDITDAKLTKEALRSTSAELERRANELQALALRTANEPPDMPRAPLTARQLEIMELVAQGLTNAQVGERLFVTEGTIKWHIRQILTKTNSRNRVEAIAHIFGGTPA